MVLTKLFNKISFNFLWKFIVIVAGSITIAFIIIYFSPKVKEKNQEYANQDEVTNVRLPLKSYPQ